MKLRYYLRGLGIGVVVTAIIMSFTRQPEKLTDAQIKMRALELGMVEKSVLSDLQEDKEVASKEGDNVQDEIPAFEDIVEVETEEADSAVENDAESETEMEMEEGSSAVENDTESETEMEEESSAVENDTESETEMEEESSEVENDMKSETDTAIGENNSVSETDSEAGESENVSTEAGNDGVDADNSSTEIPADEVVENYILISVEGGNDSFIVSGKLYEAGLVNSTVEFNQYLVRNGYDRRLRTGNHEIPVDATEEEMAKILCGMY